MTWGPTTSPRSSLTARSSDKAGNELKSAAITRLTDRIGPGVTVDAFSGQLLAAKGEATVSFSADENLSQGSVR